MVAAFLRSTWRWIAGFIVVVVTLIGLLVWPGFLRNGSAQSTPTATPTDTPVPQTATPTSTPTVTVVLLAQANSPTPTATPTPTRTPTALPMSTPPADQNDLENRVTALEGLMARMLAILERLESGSNAPMATPAPRTEGSSQTTPQSGNGNWSVSQKCEWLSRNFPQTTEAIQQLGARLANTSPQRIRTHLYRCDTANTVYDGLIVLGPNENWDGMVSMTVPLGGAIDSYPGASFTGRTTQIGSETIRAFDGTVTGVSMTFWPWLDENPPLSGELSLAPSQQTPVPMAQLTTAPIATPRPQPTSTSTPESISCVHPQDLASQQGWRDDGWADEDYGGLRIELTGNGQLPPSWEAVSSGRKITENDANRQMVTGFWTIYPPFSCREQLGFSK